MTTPRRALVRFLLFALLAMPLAIAAQQPRIYRVGVVHQGGSYWQTVDGLRDGLKEMGFEEGKQLVLQVHDANGDLKSIEAAARRLEEERVDLIYAVTTSAAVATKRATRSVPIVFYSGSDPVAVHLVESFRKPGGRLTGVHGQLTDLTAKRLELLKEMVPRLRRVVTFYNPENPAAQQSVKLARDAARQLKVELIERLVTSVEELRLGLRALRPGEADALLYVSDAMVGSHDDLLIESAMAKRLPTMLSYKGSVAKGALASYGEDYHTFGRMSAKYVQRILLGADPGTLPVEQLDRPQFFINLKTAKVLGLTIPQSVLLRADHVIE